MSSTNIHSILEKNNITCSSEQEEKLLQYLFLLQKWNKVFNLTAVRTIEDMILHHVVDSLSILSFLKGNRLIDVGTGAGLPGIPLAILQPDKNFYLLESNGKKARFLMQAKIDLNLKNTHIIHSRVEKYIADKCFDGVITRAFSSLKNMVDLTRHLVCPKGEFLAMKGVYPKDEIAEISDDYSIVVEPLKVKEIDDRCLVIIKSKSCDS